MALPAQQALDVAPRSAQSDMPLIGLTTYVEPARWGDWDMPAILLPAAYAGAVSLAGGRPILIPPADGGAQETAAILDGLVLAGGPDIDPRLYGAEPHPATGRPRTDRDSGELALLQAAIDRRLPTLGVCRGMQLMNVALGGDLVQHLPDELGADRHRAGPGRFQQHPVRVEATAPIALHLRTDTAVCSYHHQALGRLADPLQPFAWSPDGVLEGVQHRDLPFFVGVLWHPEAGDDPLLFDALIDAARAHRAARTTTTATR